ncbi:MAG: hypothetical protein WC911_01670 [Thermoleophilia bacterium]
MLHVYEAFEAYSRAHNEFSAWYHVAFREAVDRLPLMTEEEGPRTRLAIHLRLMESYAPVEALWKAYFAIKHPARAWEVSR